ncbi:MAG: SufE family protein, partial [Bacteroidales bacterium]
EILMQSIQEIEAELIEEFSLFEDWTDKYQYIIEMGQTLPSLSEEEKTEQNIIKGCQSLVWLVSEQKDGLVIYRADGDAIIAKGLIAMLIRVLSHHTAAEIVSTELSFLEATGLQEHLSPNRANGLSSMVKRMLSFARAIVKGE